MATSISWVSWTCPLDVAAMCRVVLILTAFSSCAFAQDQFRVEEWDWEWKDPIEAFGIQGEYEGNYSISATPSRSLDTEETRIEARGFLPGQFVGIVAETQTQEGDTWKSAAVFAADRNGVIDLSRLAPEAGMYRGVDSMGLF